MNIGIDIVHIPRMEKLLREQSAEAVFAPQELTDDVQTMAGKFAAKEAYRKAVGHAVDWTSVVVLKNGDGSPYLECPEGARVKLSISHDGEYAIAIVLVE